MKLPLSLFDQLSLHKNLKQIGISFAVLIIARRAMRYFGMEAAKERRRHGIDWQKMKWAGT